MKIRLCSLAVALATSAGVADLTLTGWTSFDPYTSYAITHPTPIQIRVDQTVPGTVAGPGWVVSDVVAPAITTIRAMVRVIDAAGDDDIIGIAFCWQDETHFYLLDWKRTAQTFNWGEPVVINDDHAERGIKIKKIDGAWTRDGLWGGKDGIGVSEIAGPVDMPWVQGTDYSFEIDLAPGLIVVRLNGNEIFNVADATYAGGRFTTYSFSQDNVLFGGYCATGLCVADCEDDCDLDVFDFLCFQQRFVDQDPYADFEGDGDWDVFDFLAFQNAYATGC